MRTVTAQDPLASRIIVLREGRPRSGVLQAMRQFGGTEAEVSVLLDPIEPYGPRELRRLPASEVWIDTAAHERWADAETRYRLAEELRRRAEDERERCTCGHSRRAHHAGGVDDGGCTACECTAYADQIERLTRERDEARDHRDLATGQLLMVGSEIGGDPKLDPKDHRDPRWTPTLEEAAKLRTDNERLRRALERAERALQGIATAQRFDRNVFSDDSAYVDWARSLSLHVAEIARAALAGEGEGASDASDA